MPPRRVKKAAAMPQCISRGAGMTAGLEIWRVGTTLYLYDRTADNRFAADIATWTAATGGLNAATLQIIKDAVSDSTIENPASSRPPHAGP
jgi:hypothetical protein